MLHLARHSGCLFSSSSFRGVKSSKLSAHIFKPQHCCVSVARDFVALGYDVQVAAAADRQDADPNFMFNLPKIVRNNCKSAPISAIQACLRTIHFFVAGVPLEKAGTGRVRKTSWGWGALAAVNTLSGKAPRCQSAKVSSM